MELFLFKNGNMNLKKLAEYLGYKSYNSIKKMKEEKPNKFNILYYGAVAAANNITIDDLIKSKEKTNER